MALAVKRRNQTIGGVSRFLNIPRPIEAGKVSTIAANRLILADPRGKIPARDLLEFMEGHVEPAFWKWHEKNQRIARGRGR